MKRESSRGISKASMKRKSLIIDHHPDVDPEDIIYPPKLKKLIFIFEIFGPSSKKIIFPDTISDLELRTNCTIERFELPKCLTHLTFSGYFNRDVRNANFPQTLESLTLGGNFTKDIRNANFPQNLKCLILGTHFNQDVKDANFPEGLKYLSFDFWFNQDIKDASFPKSLTHLSLDKRYCRDLKNSNFPQSLKYLSGKRYYKNIEDKPFLKRYLCC